jgi:non-specific serine/threonine protein kinase
MDWSYGLLSEQERTLLRRLSVFAGGWTLGAAEKICSADTGERAAVLDLLAQLVDKSLVTVAEFDREARYSLLETVRQYAGTKLAEVDDEPGLRRRHGDWYLRLAEDMALQLNSAAMSEALVRLEHEHDNLRAALEWSGSVDGNEEMGLRLAVALTRFWEMRGHVTEGRRWLETKVVHARSAPPYLRAAALNAAGSLAYRQGDYERVSTLCSEALAESNAHGDRRGAGRALHFLAHLRQARGEHADAAEMMARSVALHREAGDAAELANSVDCLGEIARGAGNYEQAQIFAEEALKLYGDLGHVRGKAHVLHNLAYVRLHEGKGHEAQTLFRESLALAHEVENTRDEAFAVVGLACASLGDVAPGRVARLLGAAETLLRAVEVQLEPAEAAEFRRAAEITRERLDPAAFAVAWAEGRAMTLEQAIEYALADKPTDRPGKPSSG